MVRPVAGATLMALALIFLSVSASFGHAELESASPGPGEVIGVPPTGLVARFTQDLRQDRTSIEIRDASGETIARGGRDRDRSRVQRIDLPALEPGAYEVRWVTWSAEDDELARGRYRFTVAAGSMPTADTADPSPCPSTVAPPLSPGPSASANPSEASPAPSTGDDGYVGASPDPHTDAAVDPCTMMSAAVAHDEETPSAPPTPDGSPAP